MKVNFIYTGDTLEVLQTFPDECVDCIITSPPYFGLRDYGTAKWKGGDENCDHQVGRNTRGGLTEFQKGNKGSFGDESIKNGQSCPKCGAIRIDLQIGLESTLNEYLDKMLAITAECKRVLKKTGTMWWNHGDSYASQPTGSKNALNNEFGKKFVYKGDAENALTVRTRNKKEFDVPEKCMLLQNYRLAIRMVDEQQWILRNQIIWHKPNCMPSSIKDRFTVDYESVFFFTKFKKYWFETQYEPIQTESHERYKYDFKTEGRAWDKDPNSIYGKMGSMKVNSLGRNKRCVWKIPAHPFKEAHFATFPEKLIEPMVRAGCPEFICKKCGVAREVIFEPSEEYKKLLNQSWTEDTDKSKSLRAKMGFQANTKRVSTTADYRPIGYTDCGCDHSDGWNKGIVLDPFMGSGTTAVITKKLSRDYVGIELSSDYVTIANNRLAQQTLL